MQDVRVFEKQAKPDFSKTCGQRRKASTIRIRFLLKASLYQDKTGSGARC
jgi:hypothetical protein